MVAHVAEFGRWAVAGHKVGIAGGVALLIAVLSIILAQDGPPAASTGGAPGVAGPTTQPAASRDRPAPPAASERVEDRERMVRHQIESPRDGRTPVRSPAVLEAMRLCPRHAFVPWLRRREAYTDWPLPIGHGQTISQPYIVAIMTELLELTPESKVLEIGTGSGYQAAVLAHLTPHVYTIEIVEALAKRAKQTLDEQGYTEAKCRHGDGYQGWPEEAPFDAIMATCAADKLPPPLWEQLKPGGRIVAPLGGQHEIQRLVVMTKTPEGERKEITVMAVRFVPLTRDKDGD